VGFVAERLAVFRDHEVSLSSDHARALADCADVLVGFLRANPDLRREFGEEAVRTRMAAVYWEAAYAFFSGGAYAPARPLLLAAMRCGKSPLRSLAYSVACLTGPAGVRMARAVKGTGWRSGGTLLGAVVGVLNSGLVSNVELIAWVQCLMDLSEATI